MSARSAQRTIIAGCDGRPEGTDAVVLATTLSIPLDARLVLCCVYPFDYLPREAERGLEAAEVDRRVAVERIAVPSTSVARGLHKLAAERAADLVVLGAARHAGLGRVFPGSVAAKMLHGSPCAVAVAPRGYASQAHAGLRVVGVAFDLSDESESAAREATAIARAAGAALRVIAVMDPAEHGYASLMASHRFSHANETRKRLDRRVEEIVHGLPPALGAEGRVQHGNACTQILAEAADGLDLLVMGSRSYGPLGAALLGSVSERVIESAACPVLVVPRADLARAPRSPVPRFGLAMPGAQRA
jgi:nucleotide-binding universal stress UspA family protein